MTDPAINLDREPEESLTFRAKVDDTGALRLEQPGRWLAFLASRKGKALDVTVTRRREKRSNQQNRWYWGCVVEAVADTLSIGRPLPISRDDAHELLKRAFLGTEDTPLGPMTKHSRTLTVEEFSDYVERIRAWMAQEYGLHIPGPNEQWETA